MTAKNTSNAKVGGIVGIAAGVAVAAAAATYFLYGSKNAKKYRGTLKSWMFKAKSEILERLEKLQDVTETDYQTIVEKVAEKYKNLKGMNVEDVQKFMVDMRNQWKTIKKTATPAKKKVVKAKKS